MSLSVVFFFLWENRKNTRASSRAENILKEAEEKSSQIMQSSKKESLEIISKAEKIEEKILEREEKIEIKLEQIEEKHEILVQKEDDLKNKKEKVSDLKEELKWKLAEIANLTEKEARKIFIKEIKEKYSDDWIEVIQKYKKKVEEKKKEIAKDIILKSVQQYAWDVTNEVTTTVIELPSDDIKWKLIWKEGRNITTFEKTAGVSLIIDDTPNTVFISAFDLFRRYIAKKSLEKLIEDGRIQPARIEDIYNKAAMLTGISSGEFINQIYQNFIYCFNYGSR